LSDEGLPQLELEALAQRGWFVRDGFLPEADALAAHAWAGAQRPLLRRAGFGRQNALDAKVRGDSTRFVTELSPVHAPFLALMAQLNASTGLELLSFQLQLAHYPDNGALYVRHLDALPENNPRRVTALLYLNPHWRPEHEGHLRLHVEPPVDIEPTLNRLVVFASERIEHEVRPTFAPRFAVTAWYRVTPWDSATGSPFAE
jgi:SM-20-related protein